MRTFTVDHQEHSVPDITVVPDTNPPVFEIVEGEMKGVRFSLDNIQMDEQDEGLMWYDLTTESQDREKLKSVVDSFILMILHDQLERAMNENTTVE